MSRDRIIKEGLTAFSYFKNIFNQGEAKARKELGNDFDKCLDEYLKIKHAHKTTKH